MKKFKAITSDNKIIDVTFIQFLEDGSYLVNKEFPIEEGKLLQWTGIKDVDGNELYDGWIVRIKGDHRTFYLCWYDNMCFAFNDIRNYPNRSGYATYDTDQGFPRPDQIRCIGNIFQTPDLLK